jgi:hypothetical protein
MSNLGPLQTDGATENTLETIAADLNLVVGTWKYYAGVAGTVTVGAGERIMGIAAHASVAGSVQINGGPVITIPANVSVGIEPQGNLTAPIIIFTGTDTYIIETVL